MKLSRCVCTGVIAPGVVTVGVDGGIEDERSWPQIPSRQAPQLQIVRRSLVALSVVAFLQTFQIICYGKVLIVALDWLHSRRDLVLFRVFALWEFATK